MANLSTIFPRYHPAMMEFDGSTGYYERSDPTTSGNKITVVFRFKRASFTGSGIERLVKIRGNGSFQRIAVICYSSDFSGAKAGRIGFATSNSSNTVISFMLTLDGYLDGNEHTVMYSFDGDLGEAQLIIDGVAAEDTGHADRVAPTTGTLDGGSSSDTAFGADVGGGNPSTAEIGYIGYRDAYLTNWSDFMHPNGNPKALDESGWTEWGAQPLFWNEHGDMENNLGSGGNMTRNGTIVVGKGGN